MQNAELAESRVEDLVAEEREKKEGNERRDGQRRERTSGGRRKG